MTEKKRFGLKREESVLSLIAFAISIVTLCVNFWFYFSASVTFTDPESVSVHFQPFENSLGRSEDFVELMMTVAVVNTGRNAREATFREQQITIDLPEDIESVCDIGKTKTGRIVFDMSRQARDLDFDPRGILTFKRGEVAAPFFVKPGETYVQTVLFTVSDRDHFMTRGLFTCWMAEYDGIIFTYRANHSDEDDMIEKLCQVPVSGYRKKIDKAGRNFMAFDCENTR